MSPELIAIIAVGVALAGLMLRGHRGLDKRVDGVDKRLDDFRGDIGEIRRDMGEMRRDINSRFDRFDERLRGVEIGLAEVNGHLGRITRWNEPPLAPEAGADD